MPDEIVEFVRRHTNQDEALAEGVIERNNAQWTCPSTGLVKINDTDWPINAANDRDVAEHIATHDPARILLECAARRTLLADILDLEAKLEQVVTLYDLKEHVRLVKMLLAAPYAWEDDWRPDWEPPIDDSGRDAPPQVVEGEVVQRAKELT